MHTRTFSDIYKWNDKGQLREIEISFEHTIFDIKFEENGELSELDIKNNYFNSIDIVTEKSSFDIYDKKSFLENTFASSKLRLVSKGINDDVFYYLWKNNGLRNVEIISLMNLSITQKSFKLLEGLMNLNRIEVDDCLNCTVGILKKIKKKNPNCYIELDREEVKRLWF
jgi:hypothetical protein